jgi:hypothetical protein
MSELILSKDTVRLVVNLLPKVEYLLDFDERVAIREYLDGTPTDDQQMMVLGICDAIVDSIPERLR